MSEEFLSIIPYYKVIEKLDELKQKVLELELRVRRLESPQRQKRILEILKEGPRTRRYIEKRVPNVDWQDFWDLVDKGVIEEVRRGSQHLYRLKEGG